MKRLLAAALALAAPVLALAQGATAMPQLSLEQFTAIAVNSCLQSVSTVPPYGESDIKDSPKFADYCKCFSDKFGERAYKLSQGTIPKPTPRESLAGQRAMRNGCREQLGLPQIAFKP